jgi:hypothetical protein
VIFKAFAFILRRAMSQAASLTHAQFGAPACLRRTVVSADASQCGTMQSSESRDHCGSALSTRHDVFIALCIDGGLPVPVIRTPSVSPSRTRLTLERAQLIPDDFQPRKFNFH